MLLFQSPDWRQRSERLVQEFNTQAEDRHGVARFFPFTTVSIGAVVIEGGLLSSAEDVANLAALAKHAGVGLFERRV